MSCGLFFVRYGRRCFALASTLPGATPRSASCEQSSHLAPTCCCQRLIASQSHGRRRSPIAAIPAAISSTFAVQLEPYRASSVNDRLYVSGIQKDTNSTATDTPAM